jgi:hypothetical protein
MRLQVFTSKVEIKNYKEAESTSPQHFAPWQKKARQTHRQQLKEARVLPSLELAQ